MKLSMIYFKEIIFIVLLIICHQQKASAQEIDYGTKRNPGLFYGFSFGPSQTKIVNSGILFDSTLHSSQQNSFFGSADIGYFFSAYIGISTGIGYLSYKTKLNLNAYQNSFNTIDSENEPFNMKVSGTGIQEIQTVGFLSIPFCIHLRMPLSSSFGFFLKAGINLSLPVSKKYASSGTFTYVGYYPAYNVVLANLPAHGFMNDTIIKSQGVLDIKMLRFNTLASAGFDVNITEKVQLALAANYTTALLKESYSSSEVISLPDKFQITPDAKHINSLMTGSSGTKAHSLGLEITLRFFIK
jgi:hypothetical protein